MNLDDVLEQTQWDLFWLPGGVAMVDRPEILYTACPRDDINLNAVLRVRADAARIPALVAEVDEAHRAVRSRWMLAGGSRHPELPGALARAGYSIAHEHFAYAVEVSSYVPRASPSVSVRAVATLDDLYACQEVMSRAFDRPVHRDPVADEAELAVCTGSDARVRRFVVRDAQTGAPLASGGLTVFSAQRFGLLRAGGTVPEARRRGAYAAVLAARVEAARALGLTHVGLYARVGTSAPIVEAHGFQRAGPMTYWERAPKRCP
jgi:hypothetical protein